MDRCFSCDFHDDCEFVNDYEFCDDCKDADICTIREVSCKAGYNIECNNGFEISEEFYEV